VTLEAGDTVVLMSDGFPERFNGRSEILGYERAKAVLGEAAGGVRRRPSGASLASPRHGPAAGRRMMT